MPKVANGNLVGLKSFSAPVNVVYFQKTLLELNFVSWHVLITSLTLLGDYDTPGVSYSEHPEVIF
jgi:hypothetical protein